MRHAADPLTFRSGARMPNRLMMGPITNLQSHADGTLSDEEHHWLTMRAAGGFGMTMTCAAHVNAGGQAWPGQLGVAHDGQLPGLTRLAAGIRAHGSLAVAQLFHGGVRADPALTGTQRVSASDSAKHDARGLTTEETRAIVADFVAAAARCRQAGFDGVELHAAHGYLIGQFLSPQYNQRDDAYGGTAENRARMVREMIDGVRARCGAEFLLGVRLSPERHALDFAEMTALARGLMAERQIDFLDMSLWDAFKRPEDARAAQVPLVEHFAALDRHGVRMAISGKLRSATDVARVLAAGADVAVIGRAGLLHHDFAARALADPDFVARALPVPADVLRAEGLSDRFVTYMRSWPDFVADAPGPADTAPAAGR